MPGTTEGQQGQTGGATQQAAAPEKGTFDFGAAPEAAKDAATAENTQEATDQGTQEGQTQEAQQQEPAGEEGAAPESAAQQTAAEEPFEVDGRTFATRDELTTAYRNSSSEGKRLSAQTKEDALRMEEMTARILDFEEKQGLMPFPELLSSDKDQEEAQLEMLPQAKQTEYILKKREWEQKQAVSKEALTQKRAQLAESQKRMKDVIEENDRDMSAKPAEYPGYAALKPTMQKVVELTPCIANRPETPYLSFWIAYGLNAYNEAKAKGNATSKAASDTKAQAQSAQAQAGKGGGGKPAAAQPGSESPYVKAYRDRTGSGL